VPRHRRRPRRRDHVPADRPGRAAHASQRREGVSALDNLFTVVRALEADELERNEAETDPLMTVLGLPYPTILGIVSGGEWASTVLDRVVADGRYGVKLGQTPCGRGRGPAARDRRGQRRRSVPARASGHRRDPGRPVRIGPRPVRPSAAGRARGHVEAVTGRTPALLGEPYGADMRLFINEGNTPCVIFGPAT
jgi:acetylornithine deacetylase